MVCYCGRTVLDPPIPCGTRINCNYPCSRPLLPCGHPKTPHSCHEEPSPCPPCPSLTNKLCACGKKTVNNVRCSQEKVSCGAKCGKSVFLIICPVGQHLTPLTGFSDADSIIVKGFVMVMIAELVPRLAASLANYGQYLFDFALTATGAELNPKPTRATPLCLAMPRSVILLRSRSLPSDSDSELSLWPYPPIISLR